MNVVASEDFRHRDQCIDTETRTERSRLSVRFAVWMFDPFERLSIRSSVPLVMAGRIASRAIDSPTHDPILRKDDWTFTAHF